MLEMFGIVKDIALSVAVCVTAYVAYTGLNKWQKELSGKANFDTARNLARSVYALRNAISYCRSPFTAAHEFPDGFRDGLAGYPAEKVGQAWAHVYKSRWKSVGKSVEDFDTAVLEAEALWGDGIKEKTAALSDCVKRLYVCISAFIDNKYANGAIFKDREYATQVERVIWDVKSAGNEFTKSVSEAIEGIETFIRPYLSRG